MPSLCAVAAPGEGFGLSRPARDFIGVRRAGLRRAAHRLATPPKRLRRLESRKPSRRRVNPLQLLAFDDEFVG